MTSDAALMLAIVFFVVTAAATVAYTIRYKYARLADPVLQFVFFFSLFVLPLPVRVCVSKAIEGDVTEHLLALLPYLPQAVLLSAIGLPVFAFTYYSSVADRLARRIPRPVKITRWRRAFAILALVSGLLLALLVSSSGGLLSFLLLGYNSTAEMVGKGYLAVGFPWFFVAAMFLLCGYATEKKKIQLLGFGLVLIPLLATQLVMARRGMLTYMGIAVALFWHHAVRPLRMRKVLLPGIIGFMALNLLGVLRSSGYEDWQDLGLRMAGAWEVNADTDNKFFYTLTTGEFVAPFETFPQIIASLGGSLQPEFGMTYLRAPLQAIPQAFFPGRPLPLANWYVRTFYGGGYEFNEGRAFFFLSEGYLNFGKVGVLMTMALWGLFLGAAHRYRALSRGRPGPTLLYSLTVAFLIIGIAGDATTVLVGLPELSLFAASAGLWIAAGNSGSVVA